MGGSTSREVALDDTANRICLLDAVSYRRLIRGHPAECGMGKRTIQIVHPVRLIPSDQFRLGAVSSPWG